jgi:uncharacterized protein
MAAMPVPSEVPTTASAPVHDVTWFFVLACTITWATNLPWVVSCLQGVTAPPYALPLLGLGAWGPTLAAVFVAARQGRVREVFARWRTHPAWVVIALGVSPILLHLPATLMEVALGGQPAQWFYPPDQPELVAGLVMFSLGEEFGWRGFAYPRLVRRHGPVVGSALLGGVWGLWHLGMMFTPDQGAPEPWELPYVCLSLGLSSIVWAWFLERGNRSLAVAIALHAGAHLDKVSRAPEGEVRLRVLRFLVLVVVAGLAAYSLTRSAKRAVRASSTAPA